MHDGPQFDKFDPIIGAPVSRRDVDVVVEVIVEVWTALKATDISLHRTRWFTYINFVTFVDTYDMKLRVSPSSAFFWLVA
jgi:hypothetical protein